jgi:serine/threonine protein kinase
MHEVQMYEVIKRAPHPNIAKYYGCVVDKDGLIPDCACSDTKKTLDQMVDDGDSLDHEACLSDIKAGIGHLHGLGIIHCDINPANVFLNESTFVIGDFDSSGLEGDKLGLKGGTEGWTNHDFVLAQRENDWFGFAKIKELLSPKKDSK